MASDLTSTAGGADGIAPWTVTGSRSRIDDAWFRVRQDDVRLPSGRVIDGYYVWESPHIATVVPVTTDGLVVVVRQYRHAVGKVMLQVPAGGVAAGEDPEQAARRELLEETSYLAGAVEHLADVAAYPTKLAGWHHLFLARDVKPGGVRVPDPHEPTEVLTVTPARVLDLIASGEFQVGDSVAAVLLALRTLGT